MRIRTLLAAGAVGLAGVLALSGTAQAQPPSVATLELRTVPAVPEARFELDGVPLQTDAAGMVRAQIPAGADVHTLRLLNPSIDQADTVTEFVRWVGRSLPDETYLSTLSGFRVRRDLRLQVGFRVSHRVTFAFSDPSRAVIDPARVSSVLVRSDTGQELRLPGSGRALVVGSRPVLQRNTLVASEATYAVQEVVIDGTNAVIAGEQRFAPTRQQQVPLTVPLRTVRLHSYDLLFGWPVGRVVHLTYPDGRTEPVPLDGGGQARLANLARGGYLMRVDSLGYAPVQKVEVSRSQTVRLPVLSYLDLAVVAVAIGGTVAGLLLTRRRRRRAQERGGVLDE